MPIPDRTEAERKMARQLARLFRRHKRELLIALGDPPNFTNIPPDLWTAIEVDLRQVLRKNGHARYIEAVELLTEEINIALDWSVVNQDAITWAKDYAFEWVKKINDHTRGNLQNAVTAFFDEQMTIGELSALIEPDFGARRAETIAVTETTRAAVEGEVAAVNDLEERGILMDAWWTTNRQNECAICQALDGQAADGYREGRRPYWILNGVEYDPPPSPHPRCDCGVTWRIQS